MPRVEKTTEAGNLHNRAATRERRQGGRVKRVRSAIDESSGCVRRQAQCERRPPAGARWRERPANWRSWNRRVIGQFLRKPSVVCFRTFSAAAQRRKKPLSTLVASPAQARGRQG